MQLNTTATLHHCQCYWTRERSAIDTPIQLNAIDTQLTFDDDAYAFTSNASDASEMGDAATRRRASAARRQLLKAS
jgi:hypothetical protein